ncbi:hypothetical protein [Maribacter sp.]|uniref:hypothetical protein n=1 Tax=Maribacter sp. TaxID=1897614 RepID=UPI0025BDDC15|nr:hypothetical protein [Maribacter sp.]
MNNLIGHLTVVEFLKTIVGFFSTSLIQAMGAQGGVFLDPADLYVKKKIALGNTRVKLLDVNSIQLDGVCSFDSRGKLDQNRAAVFSRIAIRYGEGAADASPGSINYNKALPAPLSNADIEIVQKGRVVLRKSVSSFATFGTATEVGADYLNLESLRYLIDDEDVEINLLFPDGVAMQAEGAATTPYIYVTIAALVTRKK